MRGEGLEGEGKESNHPAESRRAGDVLSIRVCMESCDILGSDSQKDAHARAWLRHYTATEVITLIESHPGMDILALNKVAFSDGTLSRGLTKPEKTTQLNAMHKGKDGQVPCPFCREMPGFVSVEGGRLKPCPTCKGSKYVDKVVPDASVSPGQETAFLETPETVDETQGIDEQPEDHGPEEPEEEPIF